MIRIKRRTLLLAAGAAASPLGRASAAADTALAGVDPATNAIPYLGVNLGMSNSGTGETEPLASYAQMTDIGANIFRIVCRWKSLQPEDGGPIDPAALSALETQISYATASGGVAVIDIHDYANRNTSFTVQEDAAIGTSKLVLTTTPTAFSTGATVSANGIGNHPGTTATIIKASPTILLSQPTTAVIPAGSIISLIGRIGSTYASAYFVDFWTKLAQHQAFQSNWKIWFGLMNEPALEAAAWVPICNQVIAGIRSTGAKNTISAPNAPNSGIYIQGLAFSGSSLVYEVHLYGDVNNSGTGPVSSPTIYVEGLTLAVNIARAQKQKLFLGECGFDTSDTSLAALTGMLCYLQRNTDVLEAITFWYDGVFFSDGYSYQLGSSDSVEKPQTAIIRRFMPGGDARGLAIPAPVYSLSPYGGSTAPSFASMPSFGGKTKALTATATEIYSKHPTSYTLCSTAEGLISLDQPPALLSSVWGQLRYHALQVTTDGTLLVTCGNGAATIVLNGSTNVCDGVEHRVEVNCGPKGIWVFVDGRLDALDKTPFESTDPQALRWGVGDVGQSSSNWSMWLGTLREHALWATVRHLRDHTPPAAPYTGMERGLVGYWDLNGSLSGFC
ncbi:cellulase family glycosylhydrolase [Lichenicola cladoniae]|uniref:Cellulase family glycosylhydrolase n=1 Tax=Lichenicola cladoniae TaxID=1484109 RepID=A0A6M8HJC7_9PROT|nr:cellulase family glycosylhydrolase [Lichenicola cladoniae]NPD65223.1 cellulase family glycosylhydrolase [Acetobacteraceae bacterium]QKE88818.1 cellulase family glycosylhydrolase [Lichenicola cladoniae]